MKSILLIIGFALLFGFSLNSRSLSQARLLQASNRTETNRSAGNITSTHTANGGSNQTLLPQTFWVNQEGRPGRDFIALKTTNNTFIICSNGRLTANGRNITRDALFNVIMFDQKHVGFRSHNGGYITLSNDQFTCTEKKLDERNGKFEVVRQFDQTLNIPNFDRNNAIALRINNQYMGTRNSMLSLFRDLNASTIFMGAHKTQDIANLPAGENRMERYNRTS